MAVVHQNSDCDRRRTKVHVEHLIVGGQVVAHKEVLLKRSHERIGTDVATHERNADPAVLHGRPPRRDVAGTDKHQAPESDAERHGVVNDVVFSSRQDRRHDHHWNELGALEEHLCRKRDPLQCLVLRCGREQVRKGHQVKLEDGRLRLELRVGAPQQNGHRCRTRGEYPVQKHQKERVVDVLLHSRRRVPVGFRHDSLLHEIVHHEGCHKSRRIQHHGQVPTPCCSVIDHTALHGLAPPSSAPR
mmetsp:Transcript_3915/g.11710  ORF Transcript_3915/g.11710 Transcript_3915/m.11710 type:complete len:245 (+) Transcript_3915:1878-2612(+)